MSFKNTFTLGSVLIVSFALAGCGRSPQGGAAPAAPAQTAGEAGHGGWWCDDHGVPESICALCDSKLAAKFKAKGDWCSDHDRPDSQCFECHPELEAKFAAQYEAKYGKQPPKPEGEGEGQADDEPQS